MAVTGTNNFTTTRDELIKSVLRTLNVIGIGETPVPEDFANCTEALNFLIKSWSNKGLALHATDEILLPLYQGVAKYTLGPSGGFVEEFSIVSAGTGLVDGVYPVSITPTVGDDFNGTYTVLGGVVTEVTIVDEGSNITNQTLTPEVGVELSVRVNGVYGSKPLNVFGAYLRSSSYDRRISIVSRDEYKNLPNKGILAQPNQIYYNEQRDDGFVNTFNVPCKDGDTMVLQVQRQFFDVVNPDDNFDFPSEWFNALKWNLVNEISLEYNLSAELIPVYEARAMSSLTEVFEASVEEADVYFTVSTRGR